MGLPESRERQVARTASRKALTGTIPKETHMGGSELEETPSQR